MVTVFSRVFVHVLLASMVGTATLLVVEWLLPGAVTTTIPLYAVAAGGAIALFVGAPYIREAPRWKRIVGQGIASIPLVLFAAAFALNEGRSATYVSVSLTLLLLGLMMLNALVETDES